VSPDLDKQLCKKYPEIFQKRQASIHSSCMAFGFECGDGWYCLIDSLCAALMHDVRQAHYDIDRHNEYVNSKEYDDKELNEWCKEHYSPEGLKKKKAALQTALSQLPVAEQVKEKFGTLHVYTSGGTEEHQAQISLAEILSGHTCEDCGLSDPSVITYNLMSYVRTLCPKHADEQYGKVRTPYYRKIYKQYKNGKSTCDQFQKKWDSYIKEGNKTLWDLVPADEKAQTNKTHPQ
jgi:hypothetical protein